MRYLRQEVIEDWGQIGQERIENTSVLVVGAGGLGSYALTSLARLGFGHIHLIDRSKVKESNLNRQILYYDEDIGKYKADLLGPRLKKINPNIKIKTYRDDLRNIDLKSLKPRIDIILSCLDNNESRLHLVKEAYKYRLPLIEMAVSSFYGLVLTSLYGDPCLFCGTSLMEEKEPIPALSQMVAVVANIGVNELVKWTLGIGELQRKEILYIDLISNETQSIEINLSKTCKVHGGYL